MHEVELHHGVLSSAIHDHGIGRLRALALKLQAASPTPNQVGYPHQAFGAELTQGQS